MELESSYPPTLTEWLPEDRWKLVAYLRAFESSQFSSGTMRGGITNPGAGHQVIHMPWAEYVPSVYQFVKEIESKSTNIEVPMETAFPLIQSARTDPSFRWADIQDIREWLCVVSRGDRVCEGFMLEQFNSGAVVGALRRLLHLLNEERVSKTTAMVSFIAETSVGPSAIRNQGAGGLIESARQFFKQICLDTVPDTDGGFADWLDTMTDQLLARFPQNSRYFGTARKALNLFLRDASYNKHLNEIFALERLMPLLEVPVDSYVASHLRKRFPELPELNSWPGLKGLTPGLHTIYQLKATELAEEWTVHRADLDIYFFRTN